MLTINEYIEKRKNEDGLDEFDKSKRNENTKNCVNYIFEYFNHYIDITQEDEQTILHNKKIEKYRKSLREYPESTREWLVLYYAFHGNQLNRIISNCICDDYYYLYNTDDEFNAIGYQIYYELIRKYPNLKGQQEKICEFIKAHQNVSARYSRYNSHEHITEDIDAWIKDTIEKYNVDIYCFCDSYLQRFEENPDLWPVKHKKKSKRYNELIQREHIMFESLLWDYDYRQKDNLFALNSLFRNMPVKPYTKGKKQLFETLLMYIWLNHISGDRSYWAQYLCELNN